MSVTIAAYQNSLFREGFIRCNRLDEIITSNQWVEPFKIYECILLQHWQRLVEMRIET